MTKYIRIGIADKNDNPPYFDKTLYEAEVDENEDIQHTVLTVTAKDQDECELSYLTVRPFYLSPIWLKYLQYEKINIEFVFLFLLGSRVFEIHILCPYILVYVNGGILSLQ